MLQLGAVKVCNAAYDLVKQQQGKDLLVSVVVSDEDAVDAISILRSCKEAGGLLVEPACGAALAGLKAALREDDKLVVVIVCGGNAISDALLEYYKQNCYKDEN